MGIFRHLAKASKDTFTAATGTRIPVGTPGKSKGYGVFRNPLLV